jgi:polar amino acid transport system permease protein
VGYTLNFGAVTRGFDALLWGLGLGLVMGIAGLVAGTLIGLCAAFAAAYGGPWARRAVAAYVGLIRNVPILVLALFAFFALPDVGIRLDKVSTFAVVLAVYAGAYLAETFRAAILIIPKGTIEAARSIGLTSPGIGLWVILPIAFRNALPSLGNTFISLFKDTSIAAVIAVPELTFQARKINNESFRVIEVWLTASLLYIVTCALIAAGLRRLERAFPKF